MAPQPVVVADGVPVRLDAVLGEGWAVLYAGSRPVGPWSRPVGRQGSEPAVGPGASPDGPGLGPDGPGSVPDGPGSGPDGPGSGPAGPGSRVIGDEQARPVHVTAELDPSGALRRWMRGRIVVLRPDRVVHSASRGFWRVKR
jgi:hypothetical protein